MFLVIALPNPHGRPRLALSVPRRLGTAVARNRARRRARAAFGPLLGRSRPVDLLVTVRAPVLRAPFAQVRRSAEGLLAAHGVLEAP